jgi:4'-phosphopantetheinyl transferase EntD
MPIIYQQEVDELTRLAIWHIREEESFFNVPLQREISHPHKRRQHLAGRYLLTHLFPGFPLDLVKIADTRKPFLEDESFHFSISHCSDFAAAIVSRNKRVGIDIEVPGRKVERISHKFLHNSELDDIHQLLLSNKIDQQQLLTTYWSCKEAVFKWWSYGGVDFSEMIRLQPVILSEKGIINGRFIHEDSCTPLQLHYRLFAAICLAWVVSAPK